MPAPGRGPSLRTDESKTCRGTHRDRDGTAIRAGPVLSEPKLTLLGAWYQQVTGICENRSALEQDPAVLQYRWCHLHGGTMTEYQLSPLGCWQGRQPGELPGTLHALRQVSLRILPVRMSPMPPTEYVRVARAMPSPPFPSIGLVYVRLGTR